MCPHTTMYVSSYYYVCVLILICMCSHTNVMHTVYLCVSSYYFIRLLKLLHVSSYYYTCPHSTIYVDSCYFLSSAAPSFISNCLIPATRATHRSTDHPRTLTRTTRTRKHIRTQQTVTLARTHTRPHNHRCYIREFLIQYGVHLTPSVRTSMASLEAPRVCQLFLLLFFALRLEA
jgi:hypothetical protein